MVCLVFFKEKNSDQFDKILMIWWNWKIGASETSLTSYLSSPSVDSLNEYQCKKMDEALYIQVEPAWRSQVLAPTGDFNHPRFCWRVNIEGRKHSRKFLGWINVKFLLQVTKEPQGDMVSWTSYSPTMRSLLGDVRFKGRHNCSDREMVECRKVGGKQFCSPWLQESRLWPF